MFTARAATSRITIAERLASTSISIFAQRLSGIASVGVERVRVVQGPYDEVVPIDAIDIAAPGDIAAAKGPLYNDTYTMNGLLNNLSEASVVAPHPPLAERKPMILPCAAGRPSTSDAFSRRSTAGTRARPARSTRIAMPAGLEGEDMDSIPSRQSFSPS